MTNEEIQKTMEFILEHQAQFAANIQRLEEERLRDKPRLIRLEESFQRLVQLAEITDSRQDRLESKAAVHDSNMSLLESVVANHDSNMSLTESRAAVHDSNIALLESNMARLAEAQAHSEERLSALIDIVRGRNGESYN